MPTKSRYKLFREAALRATIFARLADQSTARGLCAPGATVALAMAVAKFKPGHAEQVAARFASAGWSLYGPDWLRNRLVDLSGKSYSNDMASIVAKLLLRKTV